MRHASRLARTKSSDKTIPIGVERQAEEKLQFSMKHLRNRFNTVDDLLLEGPQKVLLVGLPGAGKSHSLCSAAAKLSKVLQDASLAEGVDISDIIIPISVDMKQYDGDLWSLGEHPACRSIA
ncbi:MAG: hypothetical protein JWS10_2065 [Cypionkella sp.]|nr:hypothetical protein [Cypionkella sp.]